MLYILTFLCCLLIDNISSKKKKSFRYLLVCWVFVFLCFGYMTGTDWRNYELIYIGEQEALRYSIFESGFGLLMSFFRLLTRDFWLFNAFCKICYLWSLVLFLQCFTEKKWTAVGVAFVFSLLFLLIDCPMRFMMALMFIQLGIRFIINKKLLPGIILLTVSAFFHVTAIIVIVFLLSYFVFKGICRLPSFVLFIVYIIALILPSIPAIFDSLYSGLSFLSFLERFQNEYNEYEVQTYISIGFWKNAVLGGLLIFSKKHVLELKYGEALFYFSFLYFILSGILSCIPTGFRLDIFNGFFFVIVLVELYFKPDYLKANKPVYKYVGIAALIVLLTHTVVNDWKYTPYSNSIIYILTEHLPYSYRDTYNYKYHILK